MTEGFQYVQILNTVFYL